MKFYPHSIGHHLGIDVHDASFVPYGEALSPGMVITIEPGLYFGKQASGVMGSDSFLGIGIRIEDDVVITEVCF